MEKRNGVWTSATRASDAEDISRYAKKIYQRADDPEIQKLAKKIRRLADDLERELR